MLESGQFKSGDKLPSEETLAKELGVSRSTLRQAMGYLEAHGLVSRRQGLGTFVSVPGGPGLVGGLERVETFRSLALRAGLVPAVVEREVQLVQGEESIRSLLDLDEKAELVRVRVVEAVSGIRSMYIVAHIPAMLATKEELETYRGSEFDFLKRRVKDPLSYTRSEVFAVGASMEVASKLLVEQGCPVLHFKESHFSRSDKAIAAADVYILTDQFHFYVVRRAL
jgi:GntR family transcriptional regulator